MGLSRGYNLPVSTPAAETEPTDHAAPKVSKRERAPREGPVLRALGWVAWALLHTLSLLASSLPAWLVYRVGALVGAVLYVVTCWREPKLNRRHRGAQRNMRIAFGRDLSPQRLRSLTWSYTRHLGYMLIEFLRVRRWTPSRATTAPPNTNRS